MARITSKRIRKLRQRYVARAGRSRLRLTDKRIQKLERERIRRGKSFESIYRRYRKKRIAHSAIHIAKAYGVTIAEAKRLRARSIREGLSVKAILVVEEKPEEKRIEAGLIQVEQHLSWLEFRKHVLDLEADQKKGELVASDFVLSVKFGELEYTGDLSGISWVEFRKFGDDLYGTENSDDLWIFKELVHGIEYLDPVSDKKTGLEVEVSTTGESE